MTAALPMPELHQPEPPPGPATRWTIDVFIPGDPKTQGSIKAINHRSTGRAVAMATNTAAQREWRAYVRDLVVQAWNRGPHDAPFAVDVEFVMPRRSGAPKSYTPEHTRRPDLDKLQRAIGDALTKVVWTDDAKVIDWHTRKREANPGETPGARIRIAILPTRRPR